MFLIDQAENRGGVPDGEIYANRLILNLENTTNHGWDEKGRAKWSTACYPDDISQLLIHYAKDEENTAFLHDIDFEDDFDDVLEAEEG